MPHKPGPAGDGQTPRHGTFATVDDVAVRWGQTPSDAEAALIELRLADVERMIVRRIPDLRLKIAAGEVAFEDVVQVEADTVVRLMRNPSGYISETDGDYSYQLARELAQGRLSILDDEWEALGIRRGRMSILVPEPVMDDDLMFVDVDHPDAPVAGSGVLMVLADSDLPADDSHQLAVTTQSAQLWLRKPGAATANPNGWVAVGAAGPSVQAGDHHGQLLSWNDITHVWEPAARSVTTQTGSTLVWSAARQAWETSPNRLQDLSDVKASQRRSGGPVVDGDILQFDSGSWVAVEGPQFLTHMRVSSPHAGDTVTFDGTDWVNAAGYTKADVDQKLSNVVSGLARKPAVQDLINDPPAAPVIGQNYIVGKAPTGLWVGHPNEVAFWDGTSWVFEAPVKGDTHTNLTSNQAMTWNGTDWVSLGSQASALKDLSGVHLGVPATDEVLTFDGTDWINKAVPKPDLTLDDLTDVDVTAVAAGDILTYDDAAGVWGPGAAAASALDDLTDVAVPAPVAGDILSYDTISGSWIGLQPSLANPSLDGLADVNAPTPDDGDVLQWDAVQGEWVGVQPTLANPSLGALSDVDVATAETDNLLSYDDVTKTWLSTSQLTVDSVSLTSGTVEAVVEDIADAADELTAVPNVKALKDYVSAEKADIRLEELLDCTELSGAVAGQVPVWSDTNDRWEPSTPAQSLKGLSDVLLNTPTDKTVLSYQTLTGKWEAWGLSLDELADCNDLSTATDGQVVSWDDNRKQWVPISPVRGGGTFASLTDVDVTTVPPVDGQSLKFNGTTSKWEPVAAPYSKTEVDTKVAPLATKVELDSKVQTLVTGLEHGVAVQSLTNTPPTNPVADEFYIVGAAGTGVWAGHNNAVTYWDGTAWQFSTPQVNETHLVEDQQATFHWNGTAWVKVASAAVGGPSAVGDLWAVGSIQQSLLTEGQFRTAMGLNSAEDRKWVLADGRDVTGSQYHTITGHDHVPDLRGAFLRMAGTNAGNTSWVGGALMAWQEDNTARPKTAFTTDSQGSHTHNVWSRRMSQYSGAGYSAALGTLSEGINAGGTVSTDGRFMDPDGAHTHTITGGGDTETRPKSMSVNYFIKVN